MLEKQNSQFRKVTLTGRFALAAVIFVAALVMAGLRPQLLRSENQSGQALSTKQKKLMEQSRQNAMSVALALHLYHSSHKHFPPPVLLGPDGKTKHSWRVAILPFIEGGLELFNRYDQKEPWDSLKNQYVLERMPDVFRHPTDDAKSTNTSYLALVGEHTAFGEALDQGLAVDDFSDGPHCTLHVLESKRNIPWTKPVDIEYTAEDKLPQFGGFFPNNFVAVCADGAGRFISSDVDEAILRAAITRHGGEPLEINEHSRFKP